MGQITDHVVAYREGQVSFGDLATFLATFPYKACPPLGWWQLWGEGHALDDTTQEMHIATAQLTDDEYLALIKAFKSRRASVHEPGDDIGGHDGGQPAAE